MGHGLRGWIGLDPKPALERCLSTLQAWRASRSPHFPASPPWPCISSRLTWSLDSASHRELAVDKKTLSLPPRRQPLRGETVLGAEQWGLGP